MSENITTPIIELIPQRNPFVMVDKLLSATETTAHTSFEIKAGNILLNNGFFSEAGLVENIAQTAAAHAGSEVKHPRLCEGTACFEPSRAHLAR